MKLTDLPSEILAARPYLFSSHPVTIEKSMLARCEEIVAAIEEVVTSQAWRERFTNQGGEGNDDPTHGVFLGYDFHLTPAGPQLIEINTNAGGGVLAALQAERADVLTDYLAMFRDECGRRPLRAVAIVDEAPSSQYLYPEFLACQQLFQQAGIVAVIADPRELMLCHGGLWLEDTRLDLVYNRLTDFQLAGDENCVLREAWLTGAAAVTPNPTHYARYAAKHNLVVLTSANELAALGVAASVRAILLAGIPRVEPVRAECAETLWERRRELFFKPATGFGARGVYRGEKITRRVFAEILAGDYLAQRYVPPSTVLTADGEMKVDLRLIVYRGRMQFAFARLYQGQATNFRTRGGGFAQAIVR